MDRNKIANWVQPLFNGYIEDYTGKDKASCFMKAIINYEDVHDIKIDHRTFCEVYSMVI